MTDSRVARNAAIVARYRAGEKMSDIARDLGLSPPRVRQIIIKETALEALREKEREAARIGLTDATHIEAAGLSARARKCLSRAGHVTLGDVRKAGPAELRRIVDLGPVTRREIRALLARMGPK